MKERIFTLKKGTEVADRFDGVTIPFQVPATVQECLTAAGSEENFVAVFNQAHALNVQKHVKTGANEDAATVESLRNDAATFKYGQVRVRGASTGTAKVSATKVQAVLGDDFLATLSPEQRAMFEAKMATLKPAPAAPAAENGAAPAPVADKKSSGKGK